MNFPTNFAAMKAVIEAPGYPLLTAYKQDFYEIDRDFLTQHDVPGASYLWVVREYGTYLVPLGIHPKLHDDALCYIDPFNGVRDVFHVANGTTTALQRSEVHSLLHRYTYQVNGGIVSKGKNPLCRFNVDVMHVEGGRKANVSFVSCEQDSLTVSDLVALKLISACEVRAKTQSFFVHMDSMTIDGEDLLCRIELARGAAAVANDLSAFSLAA